MASCQRWFHFLEWHLSCSRLSEILPRLKDPLLWLLFSRQVVSYSLRPHGLQCARLPVSLSSFLAFPWIIVGSASPALPERLLCILVVTGEVSVEC